MEREDKNWRGSERERERDRNKRKKQRETLLCVSNYQPKAPSLSLLHVFVFFIMYFQCTREYMCWICSVCVCVCPLEERL